jgi:hypothetical protein
VNYFQGRFEATHSERGQSFGSPEEIYYCQAQAALRAEELAGITPQLLEPLSDKRLGAILFMWGQKYSYFIALECSTSPPRVQLSACPLDGHFHRPMLSGDATSHAVWHVIVSKMLEAEGVVAAPFESVEEWWQETEPRLNLEAWEALERQRRQEERSEEARRRWRQALEGGEG